MNGLIDAGPLPRGLTEATPTEGRVVMGQIVARCPDCESLHRGWGDWFYCWTCYNASLDNRLRPMTWPDDIAAIVDTLMQRPQQNRNWIPGETLVQLQAENVAHGVAA
jgi:hypothetical protein